MAVYVQAYPRPGRRCQVSTDGGSCPAWAANGRELFCLTRGGKMMAVDVTMTPAFAAGRPRMLFEGKYRGTAFVRDYDVTPDGRRFVMVDFKGYQPPPAATQIVVVLNWLDELERRVPAK